MQDLIAKTTGIVLKVSPFSRTSHVVTWLTPDHGRLTTVVKGALRPKSPFLGQYDLFYTCELLFYVRDRNGTHMIRECSPLKPRPGLRADWRAGACASYLCDLILRVTFPGAGSVAMFALLDDALSRLEVSGAKPLPLLLRFELQALAASGLTPRLEHCAACGLGVADGLSRYAFSSARGGVLCPACEPKEAGRTVALDPAALGALRGWLSAAISGGGIQELPGAGSGARPLSQIEEALRTFIEFHLHAPLKSRSVVLEILH